MLALQTLLNNVEHTVPMWLQLLTTLTLIVNDSSQQQPIQVESIFVVLLE